IRSSETRREAAMTPQHSCDPAATRDEFFFAVRFSTGFARSIHSISTCRLSALGSRLSALDSASGSRLSARFGFWLRLSAFVLGFGIWDSGAGIRDLGPRLRYDPLCPLGGLQC